MSDEAKKEQDANPAQDGKIQTPLFRIHFEWPMPKDVYQKQKETDVFQKLFVAYIGPKLTKK